MPREELLVELYGIGAIKFGDFSLKSGKKSPYYVNLRILPSHPNVLAKVGRAISDMINALPEKPTRLCGIPMGGLAIASLVAVNTGIPTCYTRKEPIIYKDLVTKLQNIITEGKFEQNEMAGIQQAIMIIEKLGGLKTHGDSTYVDGEIIDGDRIGIVDDLITTSESKLEAVDLINREAERQKKKVHVVNVNVLMDREQGGRETLQRSGITLNSVATITESAELLYKSGTIDVINYNKVMSYTAGEKCLI
jgi:orotate phosphoribosyltransferase